MRLLHKTASIQIYAILGTIIGIRSRELIAADDKDEVNEFYGFCAGIACDNSITPAEVEKTAVQVGLECGPAQRQPRGISRRNCQKVFC